MEELKKKVAEHSEKLKVQEITVESIKESLYDLIETNKSTNKELKIISKAIQSQEITLSKISDMKEETKESIKRVYKVIDEKYDSLKEVNTRISKIEENIQKKEEAIKNELHTRPCITHNVIETEIKHIKEKQVKFEKAVWFVTTILISGLAGVWFKTLIR